MRTKNGAAELNDSRAACRARRLKRFAPLFSRPHRRPDLLCPASRRSRRQFSRVAGCSRERCWHRRTARSSLRYNPERGLDQGGSTTVGVAAVAAKDAAGSFPRADTASPRRSSIHRENRQLHSRKGARRRRLVGAGQFRRRGVRQRLCAVGREALRLRRAVAAPACFPLHGELGLAQPSNRNDRLSTDRATPGRRRWDCAAPRKS